MKTSISFLFSISFMTIAFSQLDANSVMGMPTVTNNTTMLAVTGAATGSVVYNIAEKNVYMFDGTTWIPVGGNNNTIGDVKYGVQTADHSGWYLLNGRNVSTLSSSAQTAATNLGFTSTLPNANNRVLKHPTSGESIGDIGGQTTTTLNQANLPNVNFTGVTSTNGAHSHTIPRRRRTIQSFNDVDFNVNFYNNGGNTNTSTAGNHNHTVTVSSGGSGQSFERYQPFLVVNTFIYLGL